MIRAYPASSRTYFPPALPADSIRCYAPFIAITFMRGEVWVETADEADGGEADAVWRPVLQGRYARARTRHAVEREEAYEFARERALAKGICGPELRITDIDDHTLDVWDRTWVGTHLSGAGKWDWRALTARLPHRAAVLPVAVWYGDDLCGLALGYASRRRANGSRHTITLIHVERRPEPPPVALRGHVVWTVTGVALGYGLAMGARRLRLRNPDRNLLDYYESLGFTAVWDGGIPVYCEREV
ncbi:hypothetical protein [Longimicrobium sp.]|uniref:hypothetical protein n=1 Tax=Longimicrobium sp. TaxID=2029185 RepID=UPI002ED9A736